MHGRLFKACRGVALGLFFLPTFVAIEAGHGLTGAHAERVASAPARSVSQEEKKPLLPAYPAVEQKMCVTARYAELSKQWQALDVSRMAPAEREEAWMAMKRRVVSPEALDAIGCAP